VALLLEIEFVQEFITVEVRPAVAGRAEEVRRCTNFNIKKKRRLRGAPRRSAGVIQKDASYISIAIYL
jgi:hypothetical protein